MDLPSWADGYVVGLGEGYAKGFAAALYPPFLLPADSPHPGPASHASMFSWRTLKTPRPLAYMDTSPKTPRVPLC